MHNPSHQIALITGASRGIGAALAVELGKRGTRCILLGRTVGGLEATDDAIRQAGGPPALLVPMDFRHADQEYDQLGAQLYERFGSLELLCGCAAMLSPLSPVGHIQPKDWQQVMQVNVTANYRLLRSLDPLLRQSPQATALFLTCSQGSMAEAYWGAYGASKAALNNLVQSYAAETQNTKIRVMLHDPGPTATALRRQAFPGENVQLLPTALQVAETLLEALPLTKQQYNGGKNAL